MLGLGAGSRPRDEPQPSGCHPGAEPDRVPLTEPDPDPSHGLTSWPGPVHPPLLALTQPLMSFSPSPPGTLKHIDWQDMAMGMA